MSRTHRGIHSAPWDLRPATDGVVRRTMIVVGRCLAVAAAILVGADPVSAAPAFLAFESGLTPLRSIPVGQEPVAVVAARNGRTNLLSP